MSSRKRSLAAPKTGSVALQCQRPWAPVKKFGTCSSVGAILDNVVEWPHFGIEFLDGEVVYLGHRDDSRGRNRSRPAQLAPARVVFWCEGSGAMTDAYHAAAGISGDSHGREFGVGISPYLHISI